MIQASTKVARANAGAAEEAQGGPGCVALSSFMGKEGRTTDSGGQARLGQPATKNGEDGVLAAESLG